MWYRVSLHVERAFVKKYSKIIFLIKCKDENVIRFAYTAYLYSELIHRSQHKCFFIFIYNKNLFICNTALFSNSLTTRLRVHNFCTLIIMDGFTTLVFYV